MIKFFLAPFKWIGGLIKDFFSPPANKRYYVNYSKVDVFINVCGIDEQNQAKLPYVITEEEILNRNYKVKNISFRRNNMNMNRLFKENTGGDFSKNMRFKND